MWRLPLLWSWSIDLLLLPMLTRTPKHSTALPRTSKHSTLSFNSVFSTPQVFLLDELVTEILLMLPVKTLMQMKCVCKSWNILISDPAFVKLHLRRSLCNPHLTLVPYWTEHYPHLIPNGMFGVSYPSLNRLLENPITIDYDPSYQFTNKDCFEVVGSCNGLLCLVGFVNNMEGKNFFFRFWNPATKTLSKKLGYLPISRFGSRLNRRYIKFIFGYDISTDTYKVVAFGAKKVKVLSFSDNIWRNIQKFPVVPFGIQTRYRQCNPHVIHQLHPCVNRGVYFRGTINWLAIQNTTEYQWNDITIEQFVILSLDLGTETYRQLRPPQGFVEVPPVEPSLTVLMDCLCFSHSFKGTHFVLWKMMKFGVQESWTQFLKISYENLQVDYQNLGSILFFPLCLSESSNTLIMASNHKSHNGCKSCYRKQVPILYNWSDNRVQKPIFTDDIDWFNAKDYVESLVSTC